MTKKKKWNKLVSPGIGRASHKRTDAHIQIDNRALQQMYSQPPRWVMLSPGKYFCCKMRDVAWRLASKQFGHLGLHGNWDCLRGLLAGCEEVLGGGQHCVPAERGRWGGGRRGASRSSSDGCCLLPRQSLRKAGVGSVTVQCLLASPLSRGVCGHPSVGRAVPTHTWHEFPHQSTRTHLFSNTPVLASFPHAPQEQPGLVCKAAVVCTGRKEKGCVVLSQDCRLACAGGNAPEIFPIPGFTWPRQGQVQCKVFFPLYFPPSPTLRGQTQSLA